MIQFDNAVVETTLIPLYMRARESRRDDAILRDPMAERIISRIDYDFTKLNKAPLSYVGCVVRGRYYDERAQKFINEHPTPIVVNIGCGLDTRYQRIADKRNALFYELDLPELMEIRRKLIPEEGSDRYLTGSLLETDWLDMLHSKHPDGDFLFIAEGVLMYFTEEQVKALLKAITDRFSAGEVDFDVCGPMMVKRGVRPDSMKGFQAQIRCGIEDGHEVERWEPRLQLIEQRLYMDFFRHRWGFIGQTLGRIPRLCRKFSSLLCYKIV